MRPPWRTPRRSPWTTFLECRYWRPWLISSSCQDVSCFSTGGSEGALRLTWRSMFTFDGPPRASICFRIVPHFIHGETIHIVGIKLCISMPRNGRTWGWFRSCQMRASRQNRCKGRVYGDFLRSVLSERLTLRSLSRWGWIWNSRRRFNATVFPW